MLQVGGVKFPSTDGITGAQTTIPVVHHEVHEGEMFLVSYKSPEGSDVADNGNITILLQTAAKFAHCVFDTSSGGPAELAFYEAPTVSVVGTALTEFNMKRYSIDTATVIATHTPTANPLGTLLLNSLVPGGSGPGQSRTGGTVRANTEWILRANTVYLMRGINRAGNAQPMSMIVQWYEESDA